MAIRYLLFFVFSLQYYNTFRLPMDISLKVNPLTGHYTITRPDSENSVRFESNFFIKTHTHLFQRNALDANVRLAFGITIFVICSMLNVRKLNLANFD